MIARTLGLLTLSISVFALLGLQTSFLSDGYVGTTLRTVAHVPLWALVSYLWLAMTQRTRMKPRWILAILTLVAILAEIIEAQLYNGYSAADLAENLIGVALGYCFWSLLSSNGAIARWKPLYLIGVLAIVSAAVLAPMAVSIHKGLDRQSWYPVLYDPRMSAASDMVLSSSDPDYVSFDLADDGLVVSLAPGRLSWVVIRKFIGDWTGFDSLRMDIENLSPEALKLEMSIRDRGGATPREEQFIYERKLLPFERAHFLIPLLAIQVGAESREVELRNISVITFSSGDLAKRFKLHSIALE